ncbi:hypothetical protein ACIA5G_20100, partial [Amycolatopsis sp. NPDC051758]
VAELLSTSGATRRDGVPVPPGPEFEPLRELVAELLSTSGATRRDGVPVPPGPEFEPLRELVADLLSTSDGNRLLSDRVSAQGVRYGDGRGLAGQFLPNLPLGERTVAELLHTGRPVLLLGPGAVGLADIAAPWKDGVDVVEHREDLGEPAILLRPDGYVAWAGAAGSPEALTTWFGPR